MTTYPWSQYSSPEEISDDYYSRLKAYTDKPIAFTEIGWISSDGSSETDQAQFLVRFLKLTRDNNVEMVNWLFLHETSINGEQAAIFSPETGTVALKKADGSRKDIYNVWHDLHDLKIAR